MILTKKALLILLLFTFTFSFSQKKLLVNIEFPSMLIAKKIAIYYSSEFGEKKITPDLVNKKTSISSVFFSKYATIIIVIDSNNCNLPHYKKFYVTDKIAFIKYLHKPTALESSQKYIKTKNVFDLSKIENQYNKFVSSEQAKIDTFMNHGSKIPRDSFNVINEGLRKKLIDKQLEFIRYNSESYYSFNIFKSYIAPNIFCNPDTLFIFYKDIFYKKFHNTYEGQNVEEILQGRIVSVHENVKAINFTATDILGNSFSLKDKIGKYVLINFWASWCIPCVEEIPAIKEIREMYPPDILDIVSVTLDNDSAKFIKAIIKNKMEWIQIYKDETVGRAFGGTVQIPLLFLIDKNGYIIYNKIYRNEVSSDLPILKKLLRQKILAK